MSGSVAVRKETEEVAAADVRDRMTELMGRAEHAGQRTIITRNNKPVAALVPISDLERLRSLDAA